MIFKSILISIKYFYLFHKLLFTLSSYKLYKTIYNKPSEKLTDQLYQDIQNSGCIIIKLIQWLHTRYSNFSDSEKLYFDEVFNNIYENPKTKLNIDLNQQIIRILGTDSTESFEINEYKKRNMLNGYDDIDYLMNIKDSIEKFAKKTPL